MSDALHVIGLMSGSSCDGIDAALVRIEGAWPQPKVRLLLATCHHFDDAFRARLLAPHMTLPELAVLDMEMGQRLGKVARGMMDHAARLGMPAAERIASHGHTLAHVPPRGEGIEGGCGTLQIGCPAAIAAATGIEVVADFRKADMAAGGQGAPLVPFADWLLFHMKRDTVACLNIGGIANVTVVTPGCEGVFAFDTGPGNMPIDGAVRHVTNGAQAYDEQGERAARGKVHRGLLEDLLAHPYFKRPLPKSTGREEFDAPVFLAEAFARQLPGDDLIATVTAAVAESIVRAIQREVLPCCKPRRLIVSGGGALNPVLMRRLRRGLDPLPVAADTKWPPSMREALAFALLGWAHAKGIPANLPSVTGAARAVVLGALTRP